MNNIGQNNFGQPDNNDDRVIINANNDIPDFQDCNNNLQLNNQGLITEINNNNGQNNNNDNNLHQNNNNNKNNAGNNNLPNNNNNSNNNLINMFNMFVTRKEFNQFRQDIINDLHQIQNNINTMQNDIIILRDEIHDIRNVINVGIKNLAQRNGQMNNMNIANIVNNMNNNMNNISGH